KSPLPRTVVRVLLRQFFSGAGTGSIGRGRAHRTNGSTDMNRGIVGRGIRLGLVAIAAVGMMASNARAHEDPSGCFETGPAIIVSVFRADGVTGVVGNVSQCETINYRATLQKAQDLDSICAFSGGT